MKTNKSVTKKALAVLAVAASVIIAVLIFTGGDDGAGPVITDDPEVTSTTPSTTTDPPTSSTSTTTTTPATTVDPGSIRNADTWDEFVELAGVPSSQLCLTSWMIASNDLTASLFWDVDHPEDGPYLIDRDGAVAFADRFATLLNLHSTIAMGSGLRDVEPSAPLVEQIEQVRAAAAETAPGDTVDVLGVYGLFWRDVHATLFTDSACPLSFQTAGFEPISSATANFASDSTAFGGRGYEASMRCASAALAASTLEDVIESTQPALAQRVDDALSMYGAWWDDRPIDDEAMAIRDRWEAIELTGTEPLSSDQVIEVQGVLDDLLSYRAAMPEGDILCPFDRGFSG